MNKKQPKREIVRVTKSFTFDMAHALNCYDGPCRNIHGHTYILWVTLSGIPEQNSEHTKNGMVADFGDLKKLVNEIIISHYDHALVLNKTTDSRLVKVLNSQFDKIILAPFQPTAENIVLEFKRVLLPVLNKDGVQLISLKLQETPTSFVEWNAHDNYK